MTELVRKPASSTASGELTNGAQTIYGAKIFNGAVSFSDTINLTGSFVAGAATDRPYDTFHTMYKSFFSGTPSTATDVNGGFYIGANAYISGSRQPTRLTGLSGVAIAFIPRTNSANGCLQFYSNLAADSATSSVVVSGEMTGVGTWAMGNTNLDATTPALVLRKTNAVNNRILSGFDAATRGYVRINAAQTNLEFEGASDRRIKEQITPIDDALGKITALNPVTFKLKTGLVTTQGFIAQEFSQVFPQAVSQTDDGTGDELPEGVEPWSMSDACLPPYLVKAIIELKALVDTLQQENTALAARVEALENA